MNNIVLIQIFRAYTPKEITLSAITGFIFFVLYTGIVITPIIVMSVLFVPYIVYFLLAIYTALAVIGSYGIRMSVETLQTYHREDILFERFVKRASVVFAALVFIVISIIYILYLE